MARITPDVKNTEPHLYFYLRLLHFYQGQLTAEAVLPPPPAGPKDLEGELAFDTVSYGVGNWAGVVTQESLRACWHGKERSFHLSRRAV